MRDAAAARPAGAARYNICTRLLVLHGAMRREAIFIIKYSCDNILIAVAATTTRWSARDVCMGGRQLRHDHACNPAPESH
eukprot:SAG31_NODE_2318_length_5944_cov_17.470488_1_plen_80_part_00